MKTKKLFITLGLSILAMSTSACTIDYTYSRSSTEYHVEDNMVSRMISADYGRHIQNQVTFLYGTALMPINPSDCGVSTFVVGDQVEIHYTGYCYEEESYPSRFTLKKDQITNIEIFPATIVEYELNPVPGDAEKIDIVPTEGFEGYTMITAEYVINEDKTYVTKEAFLETASAGTKLYGVNPSAFNSLNVIAFYSYNPRPETVK